MKKEQPKSFEDAGARLAEIVSLLERGEASLDDSIKLFEEGASLAAHCQAMLDKAEQKVVKLIKNDKGELDEETFSARGEE